MASPRHKLVVQSSRTRRFTRLAVPVAVATVMTGVVVGAAVAWPESGSQQAAAISTPLQATVDPSAGADRDQSVSRSTRRESLAPKQEKQTAEPKPVVDHLFMTAPLNIWTGPGETFTLLDVLPPGTKVAVTGRTNDGWAEIVRNGKARWVNADYLSETKPEPEPEAVGGGVLSSAPCESGSSIESGVTSNAVALYRAVCANFPQVSSYGGYRPDGEHSDGRAIDIMVSDSSLGQAIADWVRANYSALNVNDVIWSQQIWTVQRSSEGWRPMSDRGSTAANHYDHVHVQVY